MQIAADRGDPLSHQRQAVAGGVRAAGAVVMYFDCQEFGSRSVPPVLVRCRFTSRAGRACDGYGDCYVGPRVFDGVAHRGGDDKVRDLFHLGVGAKVCHVRADRLVNLKHPPDSVGKAVPQAEWFGAAAEQAYVVCARV